jgi:DNA polymerase/3'-5' exonuclease PolX
MDSFPYPMRLATAERYARQIVDWLAPFCESIAVVGSIRRERITCNDIDIVCIPKITQQRDLIGAVSGLENHLLTFLRDYVARRNPDSSRTITPRFISGGEKPGKQILLQLPKCQLDLWFANSSNWATRLMCRTGSKEHNILICQRAQACGLKWDPYTGLMDELEPGVFAPLNTPTEEDIYKTLGLPFIEPANRESAFIENLMRRHLTPA